MAGLCLSCCGPPAAPAPKDQPAPILRSIPQPDPVAVADSGPSQAAPNAIELGRVPNCAPHGDGTVEGDSALVQLAHGALKLELQEAHLPPASHYYVRDATITESHFDEVFPVPAAAEDDRHGRASLHAIARQPSYETHTSPSYPSRFFAGRQFSDFSGEDVPQEVVSSLDPTGSDAAYDGDTTLESADQQQQQLYAYGENLVAADASGPDDYAMHSVPHNFCDQPGAQHAYGAADPHNNSNSLRIEESEA